MIPQHIHATPNVKARIPSLITAFSLSSTLSIKKYILNKYKKNKIKNSVYIRSNVLHAKRTQNQKQWVKTLLRVQWGYHGQQVPSWDKRCTQTHTYTHTVMDTHTHTTFQPILC